MGCLPVVMIPPASIPNRELKIGNREYHSPISLWNSLLMVCEGPGAFSIIPCLGNKLCEQTEGLTFGAVSDKAILHKSRRIRVNIGGCLK